MRLTRSVLLACSLVLLPIACAPSPAFASSQIVDMATAADAAPASDAAVSLDMGAPVKAAVAKPDLSNPIATLGEAVEDAKAKNYMALASLILMALAFYARKYAPQAHFFQTFKGALTLCICAGALSAVGEAMYGGKLDVNTLFAGLSATASAGFALAHPTLDGKPKV
jgi:hypothetical protein